MAEAVRSSRRRAGAEQDGDLRGGAGRRAVGGPRRPARGGSDEGLGGWRLAVAGAADLQEVGVGDGPPAGLLQGRLLLCHHRSGEVRRRGSAASAWRLAVAGERD